MNDKSRFNFNNKRFKLLHNSAHGAATSDTVFHYSQTHSPITAEYAGGDIRFGRILASSSNQRLLKMVYHCMTNQGEIKSGGADAELFLNAKGQIEMKLDWRWLEGDNTHGTSHYIEVD